MHICSSNVNEAIKNVNLCNKTNKPNVSQIHNDRFMYLSLMNLICFKYSRTRVCIHITFINLFILNLFNSNGWKFYMQLKYINLVYKTWKLICSTLYVSKKNSANSKTALICRTKWTRVLLNTRRSSCNTKRISEIGSSPCAG